MKILIVEDDDRIRQELKELLENHTYEVITVDDFTKDIAEEISNIDKSLILLDINLPNQNGYDICKRVKKQENVPIIFVTSRTDDEDELKSILQVAMTL